MAGEEAVSVTNKSRESLREIADSLALIADKLRSLEEAGDIRSSCEKGMTFEAEFASIAHEKGMSVSRPPRRSRHDLVVNGKRVQCKKMEGLARSFIMIQSFTPGRGHTGYEREDWEVLAIRHKGSTAIIPVESLLMKCGVRVKTAVHVEDFYRWIDRWDVLEGDFEHHEQRQRQMELFGEPSAEGTPASTDPCLGSSTRP